MMQRPEERIPEILDRIHQLWERHPDFRFGQLIMGIANTGEHAPKLFYMEDEEFLKRLAAFEEKKGGATDKTNL